MMASNDQSRDNCSGFLGNSVHGMAPFLAKRLMKNLKSVAATADTPHQGNNSG
jgi:hypothetical protein